MGCPKIRFSSCSNTAAVTSGSKVVADNGDLREIVFGRANDRTAGENAWHSNATRAAPNKTTRSLQSLTLMVVALGRDGLKNAEIHDEKNLARGDGTN